MCIGGDAGVLTAVAIAEGGGARDPEHSMCEDLLVPCADNHVVCQASVHDRGGP
jgi:hypothetical protein